NLTPPLYLQSPYSLFQCSAPHPALHSFPTRRSSDLGATTVALTQVAYEDDSSVILFHPAAKRLHDVADIIVDLGGDVGDGVKERSEEHTSELQSRFDLVCRLLLEKKKQRIDKK